MRRLLRNIFLAAGLAAAVTATGKVSLPAIISDNMVLEQNTDARLWGWASPGEKVTVIPSWASKTGTATAVAGVDGRWECRVATPAASDTPHTLTFKGKNTIKVNNVLVGEVWLCSGQSNMAFPVGDHRTELKWQVGMENAAAQLQDADYPTMRLFIVPYVLSPLEAKDDCAGRWVVCSPETAYDFSAVGFVFGRRLSKELGIPVGLIQAAKGDTHAESWLKPALMQGNPYYDEVYASFGLDAEGNPVNPQRTHKIPSGLWNGMINPILGYTVKGNIWYQGESNAERADKYQQVLTTLIDSWRSEWRQPDMPFYFVQIAPFHRQPAAIREAQLDTWQSGVRNIGMAVITDVGDSLDIHPVNKVIPGERLALWALNRDYGRKELVCASPVYRTHRCHGDKITLTFDNASGGLKIQDGNRLTGFYVAGPDRKFVPATAVIDGNTVTVSADGVEHPVAVRYGYGTYFRANLANGAGLPASPFRTDRWCTE